MTKRPCAFTKTDRANLNCTKRWQYSGDAARSYLGADIGIAVVIPVVRGFGRLRGSERPFHFGQTVEMLPENLKGRVIDRNLMFTTLSEESGSVIQIPNHLFFQKIFRVSGNVSDVPVATVNLHEHSDSANEHLD